MSFELGYFLLGSLLILVVAIASRVKRLPLTETMIYLVVGGVLGPLGFGLLALDAYAESELLERLAEVAVIVSLFTAGLKLRAPMRDGRWRTPVRLAFVSMTLTVALLTLAGIWMLNLPLGAAILLGAVLAPTDPVLASEVQMENPHDRDRLRFSLTGEAGLNDGTAFPFVMLGLGLLGLHEIGDWGWRWLAVDVLWGIVGGLGIGAMLGTLTAWLVLWLRRERKEGVGRDEFLAIGLIAFTYGLALLAHSYGFLAVFAAGFALRSIERKHSGEQPPEEVREMSQASEQAATDEEKAPAYMAGAVLTFNEQVERILEVALVLVIGVTLSPSYLDWGYALFIAVLFLVVRPVAVLTGLLGCRASGAERGMMAWFGIRGIGSLYYLMYAVNRGLPGDTAATLISITLTAIAVSIVVHGITVTPLMAGYRGSRSARARE